MSGSVIKTVVDRSNRSEIEARIFTDFVSFAEYFSKAEILSQYFYTTIGRIDFNVYADKVEIKVNGLTEIWFSRDLSKHNFECSKDQIELLRCIEGLNLSGQNSALEVWRKDKIAKIESHVFYIVRGYENGKISNLTHVEEHNLRTDVCPDYEKFLMLNESRRKIGLSIKYRTLMRFGMPNKYGFTLIDLNRLSDEDLARWEKMLNRVAKSL
ncbi:MAG: hypothetical protein Q4A27_03415 [bacterium]|nr:hypothetical protein [bacterium]